MKTLFGTDGLRGEAGKFPLDVATVRVVGASLARHLASVSNPAPVIVVGRDTRESGPWIERALVEGATSAGARCRSAGVITTPGVAFLTRTLPADAGVVISASHNPYHDNGIKVFAPSGRKLDDATERLIEADILAGKQPQIAKSINLTDESENLKRLYLDFLVNEIGNGLSLENLNLVIDCANGSASSLAPDLFAGLGAKVVAINNDPDGQNINKASGSLHLQGLRDKVVAAQADFGVAFDGDADRSLFVARNGRYIDGDATLWILANYFQQRGELNNDMVVATVMSNIGLELALKSKGIKLIRTDVGDKYVLDELLRVGATLGGEQSGHIIFPRLSLAGDGMITSLYLLRVMQETGSSLTELLKGFEQYPQILVNVKVQKKLPFSDLPAVAAVAQRIEEALAGQGRLLLRYSGTEPLARVMIEGQSQPEIEAYAHEIADAIQRASTRVDQ